MAGRDDAQEAKLQIDFQNLADGSRTICSLSDGPANVTLNSKNGGCSTYWTVRHTEPSSSSSAPFRKRNEAAALAFNPETNQISISQTWSCLGEDGTRVSFTGTITTTLTLTCQLGREGERTRCSLTTNPTTARFLLGNTTTTTINPSTTLTNTTTCTSPPSWQILSMYYNPPGPWPRSPSYKPVENRFELRNLADGSRIRCYLSLSDTSGYESGLLLSSYGEGTDNGLCVAGRFEKNGEKWEWRDVEVPRMSFDTRSLVFGIEQVWGCPTGDGVKVKGRVEQRVEMECEETGLPWVPWQCVPGGAVYSEASGPVLLGPGVVEIVGE
ncbi:hypothetical protein QBC34DRAFT_442278 [Podospora aff. communis PSN243]|uniref:Ig-like domain-containing protein n=1 Tax=Podospora aff. communis PSN243 TaxID=3040156 RepID=A0AAV9G9C7_9PEZI|nr:hypothetical protein QBC34DRAFT_442278 [Podospora aff. communis PSN243]